MEVIEHFIQHFEILHGSISKKEHGHVPALAADQQ